MADLYRLSAKFDDVKLDEKALMFHYERKAVANANDKLAVQCYQYIMQRETLKRLEQNKTPYEKWKETQDDKDTGN